MNIFKRSIKWANKKNLLNQGINPERDIGFIFEECLEMLGENKEECNKKGLKLAAKLSKLEKKDKLSDMEIAELLDGCGDVIIYTTNFMGKILKHYGFSWISIPDNIINILNFIMEYNELKNLQIDENGKLIKTPEWEKKMRSQLPQHKITKMLRKFKRK